MKLSKSVFLCLSFTVFSLIFTANTFAQDRSRIIRSESRPVNAPYYPPAAQPPTAQPAQIKRTVISLPTIASRRPVLTNEIEVKAVAAPQTSQPLIKKTGSSQPVISVSNANNIANNSYNPIFNQKLLQAIQTRIGIPYRYGSTGPTSYDCSGLVWSVFQEAGFSFERTSARTLWQNSDPVDEINKYKFGTLVFFNGLAHVGIVADDEGFYQASSSHGVTYTKFEGYWAKRIVGFRRMKVNPTVISEIKPSAIQP